MSKDLVYMMKWFMRIKVLSYLALVVLLGVGAYFLVSKLRPSSGAYVHLYDEQITEKFATTIQQLTGKQSLYVAKLHTVEVVERTSAAKALGISLPSVVLEAEIPVEYNYYVPLSGGWRFEVRDRVLKVFPPELTSSRPAVDLAKMKFKIKKGSVLRNQKELLKKFESDIPGFLIERAIQHRDSVRDEARNSVEEFIRSWILTSMTHLEIEQVEVQFPQDSLTPSAESLQQR